jgi:hypothetical protein
MTPFRNDGTWRHGDLRDRSDASGDGSLLCRCVGAGTLRGKWESESGVVVIAFERREAMNRKRGRRSDLGGPGLGKCSCSWFTGR